MNNVHTKKKQIQPRHRNYKNSARDLAKKNKGITHELILLSRASEQKKQIGSYTYTFMHSTCERVKKKKKRNTHVCVNKAPERVKKIIKKRNTYTFIHTVREREKKQRNTHPFMHSASDCSKKKERRSEESVSAHAIQNQVDICSKLSYSLFCYSCLSLLLQLLFCFVCASVMTTGPAEKNGRNFYKKQLVPSRQK